MGTATQDAPNAEGAQLEKDAAEQPLTAAQETPQPAPRASPRPGWGWILLFSAAALLVTGVEKSLAASLMPFEMADFELTFSANRARDILTSWTEGQSPDPKCTPICAAQKTLHWDDALVPLYVVALILLVLRASAVLAGRYEDEEKKRRAAAAGKVLAVLVIAAGLLDYAENFGLGSLLQGPAGSPNPVIVYVASICALVKFVLWGVAAVFCIGIFSTGARGRAAFSLLKRLWIHLVFVFGVALLLMLVDQGQDIIRAISESFTSGDAFHGVLFYLTIVLWTASAWYWCRYMLMFRPMARGQEPDSRAPQSVALWLPRLIALSGGVLAGLAFGQAAGWPVRDVKSWQWALYAGGLVTIALSALSVVACALADGRPAESKLRRAVHKVAPLPFQHDSLQTTEFPVKLMLWLGPACAVGLFVGFAFWPVHFGQSLGPGATVLLTAIVGLPVASLLAYVEMKYRISIALCAAVLLVVFGSLGDSHRMRVLPGAEPPARLAVSQKAQAWLEHVAKEKRSGAGPIPMYLVATEGGGIRAAYWTASVLGRLADTGGQEFTDHLFAISSVSGGSLGAAVYAAEMAAPPREGAITPDVRRVLGKDLLSPTLGALVAVDFPAAFFPPLPPPFSRDRALALEHSWEDAWADAQERTRNPLADDFLGLWSEPAGRWVPSLFLNATLVESGRRIITSDVQIDRAVFPDAQDTLAEHNRVRLSTAAHLSARFPYVSPGASLPLEFYAVDGGYFDNSGAVTLGDLLAALRARSPQSGSGGAQGSGIRIGCSAGDEVCPTILFITYEESPVEKPLRGFAQLRIPPEAMLQTRTARDVYAAEQLRREAHDNGWRCTQFALKDPDHRLPLGWMLSGMAQQEMNAQADQIDFAQIRMQQ